MRLQDHELQQTTVWNNGRDRAYISISPERARRVFRLHPQASDNMTATARVAAGSARNCLTLAAPVLAAFLFLPLQAAGQLARPTDDSLNDEAKSISESAQRPRGFLFSSPIATLGLRAGFTLARTSSSLFDFTTSQLTLDDDDFNAINVGADLGLRVAAPVDVVFGFTYASTSKSSEFRDWTDQDDLPITQRTTFTHVPVTLAAKLYLTPRGRQIGRFAWVPSKIAPYIGAGGGLTYYSFRQIGSFVDFVDLSIFDAEFESSGWTPVALAMAGLDFSLGPRVVLNADARYHWANADLDEDFADFDDGIDLSGFQISLGVFFRL